ncbi:MAG TPA: alpha/beta fold hydrolase, partial [Pyrinomonadaceae bacterium]|nr:alpha/beta fold hydrolase [Pyrinomonadaceae bacterium]
GIEKYRPFRQIAEFLAARGIAVLRSDDRGVGDSGGCNTLGTATTFDFADDVRAQVAYLRSRSDIDPSRIVVIGHSEGGVIAPLVAASDPKLAAIVLLAGTARRGEDVLRFQLNYIVEHNPKLSEEEKAKGRADTESFLRAIRENGDVSKFPLPLRGLNSAWGRAFLDYDPTTTIRKVRQPILILQGALDQQVTPEQAHMLEEAARAGGNKDITVRVFPNLNHLFLPSKTGAEREYTSLETYSLSDELLGAIADWLQVKLKVGK